MKSSKILKFGSSIFLSSLFFFSIPLVHPVFGEEGQDTHNSSGGRPPHWDYLGVEGPQHWGMLTEEYRACETGNRQSPVNISMVHHGQGHDKLVFHYETSEIHELNNGHTIQVSHLSGCRVDLNQREYQLRQFHFHAPSEHHVEGNAYPMELHLVHQDDQGHVLVVSALMEATSDHSVLGNLWDWLPHQIGKEVSVPLQVHLMDILPKNTHHFSYSGSLTTPPCTEGVQWIVLQEPISVSQQDVDRFVKIIGYNARPVQPLGQREIEEK
jgi:carbonic anhydrase